MRLVVDWDATCTVADTLELVLLEFGDREVFRRCEEALTRGEMSYRELMKTERAALAADRVFRPRRARRLPRREQRLL